MAKKQKIEDLGVREIKVVAQVRPGDIVFIEVERQLSVQQMEHINRQFKERLPEVKIVILNGGARLAGVQTPQQMEKESAKAD